MKVTLLAPIASLSGLSEYSALTYYTVNGRTYARTKWGLAKDPTGEQLMLRNYRRLASRNWKRLTEAERAAWTRYAKAYYGTDEQGAPVPANGISIYTGAMTTRQVLGLPMISAAPTKPPPLSVVSIEQSAQPAETLGLVVEHLIAAPTGHRLLVRMTDATRSVACAPEEKNYRLVRGVDPASAVPLPASGTLVRFTPTRFTLEQGERYGVEVRIVRTADGIMSPPTYGDFLKTT